MDDVVGHRPVSPFMQRRRLSAQLRALRESANRSAEAVAGALGWSASKVSRYERAKTTPKPAEVERLLDLYQVPGTRRAALLALAKAAAQKEWWERYDPTLAGHHKECIGLEREASLIWSWNAGVLPALLQTVDYAQHVISSYDEIEPVSPAGVGRRVRVWMQRQGVLDRDGVTLAVVLDESVLRRQVGTPHVMLDQCSRLAEDALRDNVEIRVLPATAQRRVFPESFVIFGFKGERDEDQLADVVWSEQLTTGFALQGERDAYLYRRAFRALQDASLSAEDSQGLIRATAEELWRID